ncbi:MAG: acyl-ACP--UDP-N-acetylglucosamine O-acyltransferase [Pseudomonadota bacterium]
MTIHQTSIVADGAQLGEGVSIGPFCQIGPNAVLEDGVELVSHVVVAGRTTIGARSRIFSFAALGLDPQDLKYRGEETRLTLGQDCIVRENVTMHPGTEGGGGLTALGNKCVFLAGSHVAHDCRIGNGVIASNNVMLAGHVTVEDNVIFGGGSAVHQFARIGTGAFVGGLAGVEQDLVPFAIAIGHRAEVAGPNVVGLRRAGFNKSQIHELRNAYRRIFEGDLTMKEAVEELEAEFNALSAADRSPLIESLLAFVSQDTARQYCSMRKRAL